MTLLEYGSVFFVRDDIMSEWVIKIIIFFMLQKKNIDFLHAFYYNCSVFNKCNNLIL